MANARQSDVRITLSALPGVEFTTVSGREVVAEVLKNRRTAGAAHTLTSDRPVFGDITVTKIYEPDLDSTWVKRFGRRPMQQTSVTVTMIDLDNNPIPGDTVTYIGTVTTVTEMDGDADASELGIVSLVIAVSTRT